MGELFSNFGLDWKVLIAQIVNFALLLFLLKKYAYGPVLKILDERKKKIDEAIEKSKTVERKMLEIDAAKEKILDEARRSSEDIIKKAAAAALRVQEDILKDSHEKSERLLQEAEKKIQAEKEKASQEVKREIGAVLVQAIERSLGDVVDRAVQEKLTARALEVLRNEN